MAIKKMKKTKSNIKKKKSAVRKLNRLQNKKSRKMKQKVSAKNASKKIKRKKKEIDLSKYDRGYRALYKRVNIIDSVREEIKREAKMKKHPPLATFSTAEVNQAISMIKNNSAAVEYLKKNVSSMTLDILSTLSEPKIDDKIAEALNIKINVVRRVLNMLQNYGITNYYIAKNANGWLSFAWYVNVDKIPAFIESLTKQENKKVEIDDNCNDYFICPNCYKNTKIMYPFDIAYENTFKCSICNGKLTQVSREEIEKMMESTDNTATNK
ncbi:MAG: hypothetical protein ACP5RI_01685 [Candidatus Micrarchaeia archaeon]